MTDVLEKEICLLLVGSNIGKRECTVRWIYFYHEKFVTKLSKKINWLKKGCLTIVKFSKDTG